MEKKKIDFKNVLAGIGIGFLIILILATVSMSNRPDNYLTALLSGNDINSKVIEDDVDPFSPLEDEECDFEEYGYGGIIKSFADYLGEEPATIVQGKDGSFYVLLKQKDSGGNSDRVAKFDSEFKPVNFTFTKSQFIGGRSGNQPVQFIDSADNLSVDNTGNIYVISTSNADRTMHKFDSSGKQISQWPLEGVRNSDFDIATDKYSNSFVIHIDNDENKDNIYVTKYDKNGGEVLKWGDPDWHGVQITPWYIAVNVEGTYFYTVDGNTKKVFKYNANDNNEAPLSWDLDLQDYKDITNIEVDSLGNVYILSRKDQFSSRLEQFDANGKSILISKIITNNLNNYDFTIGEGGKIYLLGFDYSEQKFIIPQLKRTCARLTIIKDTVPDDFNQFTFNEDITAKKSFILIDAGKSSNQNSKTLQIFNEGVYNVSEIKDDLYETKITCDNAKVNINQQKLSLSVDMKYGDEIICRFKNTKKPKTDTPRGDTIAE